MPVRHCLLLAVVLFATGLRISVANAQESGSGAADPSPEGQAFFESKIRPVLVRHCYGCHSTDAANVGGELRLDSRAGWNEGGDSGPAIVPGRPDESLLMEALRYETEGFQMPPRKAGGKLPDHVIADFETWIGMGAPDPRDGSTWVPESGAGDIAKQWWSFQPRRDVPPPEVRDAAWPRGTIDRFVLARLEQEGLGPAGDAPPLTLLRRLTFDLTGLPPSADAARAFELAWRDTESDAERDRLYQREVDRLLASPQFGEHWGRHWLDVARYSESSGKDVNILYPEAWRYRDYVIDAFNDDRPFDQFVREQIAGDLLPAADDAQRSRQLVATGFLALGPRSLNEQNPRQFIVDQADEQIDTTTQAFLGLTVACARCHDHKFDPISQKEYTALAGIFLSTDTRYGTSGSIGGRNGGQLIELPADTARVLVRPITASQYEAQSKRVEELREEVRQLVASRARQRNETPPANQAVNVGRLTSQIALIEAELRNYNPDGSVRALAMGVVDRPRSGSSSQGNLRDRLRRRSAGFVSLTDSPLFIRGEIDRPAERIQRGVPQLFDSQPGRDVPRSTSGRAELADWIVDPSNPLTARVMVNRIWHWLFGAGIVTSVDNFGNSGSAPSHPELLDHLANRFIENGWSVKSLIREIVLSRTYRLASTHDDRCFAADPSNALLWRHSPRRLEAESIRDAMLAAAGTLDLQRPAGSLIGRAGDGPVGGPRRGGVQEDAIINNTSPVRSVYLSAGRNVEPGILNAFDFPDAAAVQGARQQTNVPAQILFLLNSEFMATQARALAQRIAGAVPQPSRSRNARRPAPAPEIDRNDIPRQVEELYWMTLGRPPTSEETNAVRKLLLRYRRDPLTAWSSAARAVLATSEFRSID